MRIKHGTHGEVDGVRTQTPTLTEYHKAWEKTGAVYYEKHGWNEMPEGGWVDVTWASIVGGNGDSKLLLPADVPLFLPYGYRFKLTKNCANPSSMAHGMEACLKLEQWQEQGGE